MTRRITEEEVNRLYKEYHTPAHVIAHCRAVTEVAVGIGELLNRSGYHLDIELIRGAGLVHDAARTSENHGQVCAERLEELGFFDEAAIVCVHMTYQFQTVDKLTETDMLCFGDRLVKEDKYVGIDERFRYIMDKAPKIPSIQSHLAEHRERMRHLLQQIEEITGASIDALFEKTN